MRGTDYSRARLGDDPSDQGGNAASASPDSAFLQLVRPTGYGDSIDRTWRAVVAQSGWKQLHERLRQWIADTGDRFTLPEM